MTIPYHTRGNEPGDFHRTNINLYASDVDWLQSKHGYGWTTAVRELIHKHVRRYGLDETTCPHCGKPIKGPR